MEGGGCAASGVVGYPSIWSTEGIHSSALCPPTSLAPCCMRLVAATLPDCVADPWVLLEPLQECPLADHPAVPAHWVPGCMPAVRVQTAAPRRRAPPATSSVGRPPPLNTAARRTGQATGWAPSGRTTQTTTTRGGPGGRTPGGSSSAPCPSTASASLLRERGVQGEQCPPAGVVPAFKSPSLWAQLAGRGHPSREGVMPHSLGVVGRVAHPVC
jgi:hypothetical protein